MSEVTSLSAVELSAAIHARMLSSREVMIAYLEQIRRFNPAVKALADRLKAQGRLKGKQIVVAAMRKLLTLCFGVLKTGQPFDPALAMPAPRASA